MPSEACRYQRARNKELTGQESAILTFLLKNAASNAMIAEQFGISLHTTKQYMTHIFDKTGCGSRLELAVRFLPPLATNISEVNRRLQWQ